MLRRSQRQSYASIVAVLLCGAMLATLAPRERPLFTLRTADSGAGAVPDELERRAAASRQMSAQFNTRWRNADWPGERYWLMQLARQLPDGIQRARTHLRLARMGPQESMWVRMHILEAHRILAELMSDAPQTPGLLQAVADANRTNRYRRINSTTEFYRPSREFLEARWSAGETDAAEAGYLLSQLVFATNSSAERESANRAGQRLLREVIERFPESDWAIHAEYDLTPFLETPGSTEGDDSLLRRYVSFADQHPGHPLAAIALLRAASGYGFGGYPQAQHSDVAHIERVERSLELYIRYEREYPDRVLEWPETDLRQKAPSVMIWGEIPDDLDAARLEQLALEYYALNPHGDPSLINTLAGLRQGRKERPIRAKSSEFNREFWDRVEDLAEPEALPDVRLARAWHMSMYQHWPTPEEQLAQYREASDILEQVRKDYPGTNADAIALDALARLAIVRQQPERALAWWDELAEQFPDHPLNRPVAVERLKLEHSPEDGETWRAALSDLQERFPDDPCFSLVAHCERAMSFRRERDIASARREFEAALEFWDVVFPGNQSVTGPLGPLHEIRAGMFKRAGLVDREDSKSDLFFVADRSVDTLEEQLAVYAEVLERFPDSPRYATHAFQLVKLQLEARRMDEARDTLRRLVNNESMNANTRLSARAGLIRVDYQTAENPSADDAVRRLVAALREHVRTAEMWQPESPYEADVASLYEYVFSVSDGLQTVPQTLLEHNAPHLWYLLTGSFGTVQGEFHDGLRLRIPVILPIPKVIEDRAIQLSYPDQLLTVLGVGDPQAARFIEEVVRNVFVMHTEENQKLANPVIRYEEFQPPVPIGQEPRAEDENAPVPAAPLVVRQRQLVGGFRFYNAERTRAGVSHQSPAYFGEDAGGGLFLYYERIGDQWQSSDGDGWPHWFGY